MLPYTRAALFVIHICVNIIYISLCNTKTSPALQNYCNYCTFFNFFFALLLFEVEGKSKRGPEEGRAEGGARRAPSYPRHDDRTKQKRLRRWSRDRRAVLGALGGNAFDDRGGAAAEATAPGPEAPAESAAAAAAARDRQI